VLYVGDWPAAERLLALVRENLAQHALGVCNAKELCVQGVLRIQRGDHSGLETFRAGLDDLRKSEFLMRYPAYLGALARGLELIGNSGEARRVIDEAIATCGQGGETWCLPELVRLKGRMLRSEAHFREALDLARQQGALSWELRAAASLARL